MPKIRQKLTLYLRKDKILKDGRMPLYIRFRRIEGKEPKFPFYRGLTLLPEEWDNIRQRCLDPGLDTIVQNEYQRIQTEILKAEFESIELSYDELKLIVTNREGGSRSPENRSFYSYWEQCVSNRLANGRIGESTAKGYASTLHMLKHLYPNLRVKDMSASVIMALDREVLARAQKKGLEAHSGRQNHKKRIRSVIRYIRNIGVPIYDPFAFEDVRIEPVAGNNGILTRSEIKKLIKHQLKLSRCKTDDKNPGLVRQALDMFLLSCFTGLAISDVRSLNRSEIDVSEPEKWIITKKRTKTLRTRKSLPAKVPVALFLENWLLPRYIEDPNPLSSLVFDLPLSSNTINRYLKRIAKAVGIRKPISFHYGRRTFATLLAEQNTQQYVVRNMMGHSPKNITEHYQKWTDEQVLKHIEDVQFIHIPYPF